MIKSLLAIILLATIAQGQQITPYFVLPVHSAQNVVTSYSFLFYTDTEIMSNAQVSIIFPFEFSPNALTQVTKVSYLTTGTQLQNATWSLSLYTFTIQINSIAIGNITVVIDGVLNPKDYTTSSHFTVQTLFKNVVVTYNQQFGRVPFTTPPIVTTGGIVSNFVNRYIEQGSSWTFNFTLANSYTSNSTIRFIFPQDFLSNKIQCNVSGVVDPNMKTRVFPNQRVYDCMNLGQPLSGNIAIVLSGVVNPNYQMTASGFQVHILQPNNIIASEIITSTSTINILNKPLNTTLTIPNSYRNNSATYIFQINPDTNLVAGDYMVFTFTGLWTLFTNATSIISGVTSTPTRFPIWKSVVNTSASTTTLTLTNFNSIPKTTQFTFYLPLVTPIVASFPGNYVLTINSYRFNGGLAQTYSRNIMINQTTAYIRQMKLHPMQRAIKLPVGQTGPLQIVLFLQNNLPQTNVLTYGKIVMEITPNIPEPIVSLNGVPKCYFYMNIPAANCSFDSSNPLMTVVTIFTPVNFNFQQSEVPLTITTEGYQQPINQGITIDTLVKRYFFKIQFYSNVRPPPTPQQVIFDEWIPDSIPIGSVSCTTVVLNSYEYQHLKCSFTTPTQILNSNGHIHFFRIEFSQSTGWGWYPVSSNIITPDYPCLMYGVNVSANPYVRCDYVTWTGGPHQSSQSGSSYNYITFYGLSTIPGGSTITFEIPKIQRYVNGYDTSIKFSILQDTPGYSSPIVYLYTQTISTGTNYGGVSGYSYENPSITLSNSIINKVTSITLNNYALGTSGVTQVIFEVDQAAFPNIGRGNNIACGSHACSKFDLPIQYFILYPSSTLGSSATLTFPSIQTPPYSGSFAFYIRTYQSASTIKKAYFYVVVNPETIVDCSYKFSPLETVSTLYPNSDRFYVISWATVNPVLSQSGNSYILITINNVFSFSSNYCYLTTNAPSYDGRGVFCQLSTGGTQVYLKNLNNIPAGATFNLTLQMRSTSSASTVSPTVNIQTYYGNGALVDQVINLPFATTPLSNSLMSVFTSFVVPSAFTSVRAITDGYYGPLIISFQPQDSASVANGSKIIITMATGFVPAGNTLGLPLSCILNSIRQPCTYTLNPFTITLTGTNSLFTTSINTINITTLYQNTNGITFPSAGRYLLQMQIINSSISQTLQKVQQYVDILPKDISYFNVTSAHRDRNQPTIYTVQFKNGGTSIPSYNHATTAGRIYIGFPTTNAASATVFTPTLGFANTQGLFLPCFFDSGTNFVAATAGKSLACKLRISSVTGNPAWVEIINFALIPSGYTFRVFIGKITNPVNQQIDMNFILKVNTIAISTNIQSPLYLTTYNYFLDMLVASITNRNQLNSSSLLFQPGSTIGQANRYFNITPYTANTFQTNDWFIVIMDTQFPLSGVITNCQSPFYQYCIIYPTINWLAIKIGNGTIIPLQPYISQLPISISRVDTTFTCYTFLSARFSELITYTVTAASRWLELRGTISGFSIQTLGSQNKLNVGQKNVQILISFTVSHMVPIGGTIEIQFPNNSTAVPAIKPHCRSAVSASSALNGFNTGKPSVNVQGEIGCIVQNTYSWIITGFDTLAAGSQVKIFGFIDFPTVPLNSLGMGYICTYSNQHSSNAFVNAKTISYLTTNFPFPVQNLTWNVDTVMTMKKTQPLRTGHTGEFKFVLKLASELSSSASGGYIIISLWYYSITGAAGGFNGPTNNLVCTIFNPITQYKYGCFISSFASPGTYQAYKIETFQPLPVSTNYQITIATQRGSQPQGINYPTTIGTYKITAQILYSSSTSARISSASYIDVYGPNFNTLFFNSTITMPGDNNFIMVIFTPSSTIATNQQFIIEIPTISVDGTSQFPVDLGVGYEDYDNLIFDLFESGISSMSCKVFTGDTSAYQPVKIVCSNFNTAITTAMTVKFGFWVVNPQSSISMAIPVQVYAFDQPSQTKFCWSIIEAGIRIIPTSVTPTNDIGNWVSSTPFRGIYSTTLQFTTRNTKSMVQYDWYILKLNFGFDPSGIYTNQFIYNSNDGGTSDVIFMKKCQTILLRISATVLTIPTPGSTTLNAKINSLFNNPFTQLTSSQALILGYIVYNSADACQKVIYKDSLPAHLPYQPSDQSFSMTSVYANSQMLQSDDYRFSFAMSAGMTATVSPLKLISIQFPNITTHDIKIQGQQCYQYSSSAIEVDKCIIDSANRVIWITPVIKTYYYSSIITIQTAGLAIQNPSSSINLNKFIIKYYTWPDGQSQPTISKDSDDWCFARQDSNTLNSQTLTFTSVSSTKYTPHTSVSVPKQVVVNEWQPADYYVGNPTYGNLDKTPFVFKFIAPQAFSSLSGGSYHEIKLTYSSYYSIPTLNQFSNDLQLYVPTCELNGNRIHSCAISSGSITMSFQNALSNGQEVAVRFSIVNPRDEGDQGFELNTIADGTIVLPIYITPSGGTTYYIQPQPFHPFYKATSTGAAYPSMGISNVNIYWGTQANGQLNYLEFVITVTRTDINGLVLQIPVVAEDGVIIYNNPILLGLPSGSKYPCSMGVYTNVYCYYIAGSSTNYGTPTRIYIVDFTVPANNSISFRMLFTNPDVVDSFPKFTFKAFGGSFSAPNTMGDELKGFYTIVDPYNVYSSANYYSTGTTTCYPSKGIWQTQTVYDCYIGGQDQPANTYAILRWPLVDPTYGTIGEYDSSFGLYDHFFMSAHGTDQINVMYAYIVIKLSSAYSASGSSYYRFGYIRMKHHIINSYNLYLLAKDWTKLYTASVDHGWFLTQRSWNYGGAVAIDVIDVQKRQCNVWSWHYMAISTSSYTFVFNGNQPSSLVYEILPDSGKTFNTLSSSYTICQIDTGVIGYDPLNPVTCLVDVANTRFVISNFYRFTNTHLRIFFYAKMACSQSGFDVTVRLFANQQALIEYNWPLYYSSSGQGWTLNAMWYSYNSWTGEYNTNGYVSVQPAYQVMSPTSSDGYATSQNVFSVGANSGYVQVVQVSTTSVKFRMLIQNDYDFSAYTYRIGFRFYVQRLQSSGQSCNSLSVWSSRYGSSPWAYYGSQSCGTGDRMYYAGWYMYRSSRTYQSAWRQWVTGEYYDFAFTFNSIGVDSNTNANQVYVQGTLQYEQTGWYSTNQDKCGCCSAQCCTNWRCNSGCDSYTCGLFNNLCCTNSCKTETCLSQVCCTPCSCRHLWGWNYIAFTNNAGGWSQGVSSISQSQSIQLVSNQFGVQTQFSFYLQNLYTSFTSTMTSGTANSNAQLVISFTGNNVFPNGDPFKYTSHSQSAAYIDCLCVVSGSAITISAGTSYTAANCTRYLISPFPPFITVRVAASTNQYLACYFPGFNNPTTSGNGWTLYANFYRDVQHHFKYWDLPNQFRSTYQTTGISIGLGNPSYNGFTSLTYSGYFWDIGGQVLETKQYRLYIEAPASKNYPILYHSAISPRFQQSICNSGSYSICRAYNSFFTRRYYIVVQYSGWTSSYNLIGNLKFPQSDQAESGYYSTYYGFTNGGFSDYYSAASGSLTQSKLSPATPTIGLATATYSTNLRYMKSLMSVSINLAGFTLYSNQRTQGPFVGSFASLTLSGLSSLNGCGVYISNVPTPAWKNNAFYCIIQSSTQLRIYSNADWVFTGTMYVTFQTDSVPSSSSYAFILYDRYVSASSYGKAISASGSFSRTVSSSYSTLQPTSMRWRRQAFKQISSSSGPIRLTLNNNYQYVSIYSVSSNAEDGSLSSAIQVYVPGSGITNTAYYCYLRQYLPNQEQIYKEYVVNCQYYTITQILVKSIPSHVLNPIYFYELIIYKNAGSGSSLISVPSPSSYVMQVKTVKSYSSPSILYLSSIPVLNYLNTYPITLNSIYILTREAAAINSLFIDFTINFAMSSSSIYYLEFIFNNLDLNYFSISNGQVIPCYLDTDFNTYPGKQNPPKCLGFAEGVGKTSPLIIRVFKFAGFSSGTNFHIAFDNFNNPPLNTLTLVPINLRLNLMDRTNTKLYTSYFPSVYISDSVNVGVPTNLGGSIGRASSTRGASTYHYMSLSWPYTSSNVVSQKIVMKITKGITCCQSFNSLTLRDSQIGYTLIWSNPNANISVYRTPSKSSGSSINWQILSVINPNMVSQQTYDKVPQISFMMYNNYQTKYITTVAQPAFSSYTKVNDFSVTGSPSPIETTTNYYCHADFPMTYEFNWGFGANSYASRNISYIIMYFTSGIRQLDYAWFRYQPSPYFTNPNGHVKVGKDNTNNQWFINITGVTNSYFSTSYNWYVRVRLYASGDSNYFYYISSAYNYNGGLEFTATSGNRHLPTDSWTSSGSYDPPTTWNIEFQRYTRGYYELQSNAIYAATSQTTNKLFFKFNAPYAMASIDSISFISSAPTLLASTTPNNKLYCMFQKTSYTLSIYGQGLYAPCTFSSGTYSINIPSGGMTTGEYLLTIIDRSQLTSTFNMPTTPQRVQVSLIYNNMLTTLQYGDVYTLDFVGQMTSYSVSHSTLIGNAMDMLGFTFTSPFTLPASSTTSPVTQSVLSFEIQSNYYDSCLKISPNVFSADSMTFYNGIYYSHFSSPAVTNANTRILCGQNTQNQNWAPIKLTITDYGTVTAGTNYFFRFPLITLPSSNTSPLTYNIKLLQYANGQAFPTVISQFSYQNLYSVTTSTGSQNEVAYINLGTSVVQNTMTVSFNYHSSWFNIYYNGYQTLVKFENDAISSLTSITSLTSLSNSWYDYQYYPNINLCSFIKNVNVDSYGFNLGSFPTAVDVQTFKISYVFTYTSLTYIHYASFSSQAYYQASTSKVSTWTSSSFTKGSNLLSSNSDDLYTVTWSADYLTFPQGGYMSVTFPSYYTMTDEFCYSYSGFIQGTTNVNSNLVCKRMNSNSVNIYGYASLSASAILSIKVYLRVNNIAVTTYTDSVQIIVYSSTSNHIIEASINAYTLPLSQVGGLKLGLSGTMVSPYTSNSAFPLYITFQLNNYALVNGDWLQIDFGNWVLDVATTGVQVFKYRLSGNIYWVPSQATLVSGNIYKIPVYSNYSIPAGTQITLWVDTFAPTSYYGAKSTSTKWNTFKIFAYKSSAVVEQQITRIWTEPYGHPSFTATPVLNYVSETTLWQFSVTPNISAAAGDTILMQFQTCDQLNGLQTALFSNTLGASIPAGNSGSFDCNQFYQTNVISSSIIRCRVYAGDNTQTPPIPTTIAIPINLAIAANTLIRFNILNIVNPAVANYPISIVFKLATPCSSNDGNNLCAYYKSVTYLTFNNYPGVPGYGTTGSLTFNPSIVSATNTLHTISASYALQSGDFLKLTYYSEIPIPTTCTFTSNKGQCYSYSTLNIIIIKINQTISSPYTLVLGGMTNPYQNTYGTSTFNTQIWRSGSVLAKFYTNYAATTITSDPTTGTALRISFAPTLTPNYELKYGFNNIANVTLTNMIQNANIKQIRINAPGQISINTQYCNATMQTFAGEALPYPYRFVCQVMSSNYVILNLFSNFPTWNSGFTQRSIYVYLRYTIQNYQTVTSNNWNAYSYTDPSTTSGNYVVSYAVGNFPIVEYQVPFLYVISFPTRSFNQRTCTIGQKCMIYGFLYPTTPFASIPINRMSFLLPKEFNYSSAQSFDSCTVQPTTTSLYSASCPISRNSSQITIGFTPNTYNQLYNLINIDHSSSSMLFTAPNLPGNHYQMQVNLWSTTNTLVQSQYINLTTVYGYYLSVPLIFFYIPLDASSKGLYDLTFTTGTADILPSYTNSVTYTVTSAIEVSFANTFDASLGTGLAAGSQIACLPISGLTFNIMGKLTCKIYPSVSTITYPTIIVTGYDRIYAGTVVRIQFANLKTLAAGITDYCTLGVSYTYYNYGGAKGFIYQPVSFVVGPTTAPNTPITITYTISQISTNFVGELSDYTLAGSIASGFSPITTNDYFVVQFPPFIVEGRFNLNAQALCSLAASNKCYVFGLANQIYIQPSATVSSGSFSFTILKILNAAYEIQYIQQSVTLFTVVGRKVNALGTATFLKFTQASKNVTAKIISIDSIYGGDSGINYYFSFQLNSYLPQFGKVSITIPEIFYSLFSINANCYINSASLLLMGTQANCKIIDNYQIIISPNGVLLSASQAYYFTVTNITNPNNDMSSQSFKIETYYTSDVYNSRVISRASFKNPAISVITVKTCELQVSASIYNQNLQAQYQINLICGATIKSSSQLKLYLSWNPTPTNLTCSSDSGNLYSTQCRILTEYSKTTKLTYLSIFLRSIQAQKLISITASVTNGPQGTYSISSSVSYNGFVYLQATSNSYYIAGSTNTASTVVTVKSSNYPLNRYQSSIYTFAVTNPKTVVSTLQIVVPSVIVKSTSGVNCGHQNYTAVDDYFSLMLKNGTNMLSCNMTGQKITITGLSSILERLSQSSFLYLTINGLVNPPTSVSQSNFSFSFINTTSSIYKAVGIYSIPLSYGVSNPPANMQISSIILSDRKYYVNSVHTFTITTTLTIIKNTRMGIMIKFPQQYAEIWQQITVPSVLNLVINSVTYAASNINIKYPYLFARLPINAFTAQVSVTSLTVSFNFKNPNKSIDCTVSPVYLITFFDFQGNTIFGQTLSNNQICPSLTSRLLAINVAGNTKISAGTSTSFIVTIEKPASYLAITPACTSSAISFIPSVIIFRDFTSTAANFSISAAVGLTGSYNVTFSKVQTSQIYYNDIKFTTLNVYAPTSSYKIKITTFSTKSTGYPIPATWTLQNLSPNEFSLTYSHNCHSDFSLTPAGRITVPPQTKQVNFYVQYNGQKVPSACQLNFTISSLTKTYFELEHFILYLSGKISFDKSSNTRPLILELTTNPKDSQNVGAIIVSANGAGSSSSDKYYVSNTPTVSTLTISKSGSNSATFAVTTSINGTVYFVILSSGTPTSTITQAQIYNKTLSNGVFYGNSPAALDQKGVNIISKLSATTLTVQTNYIIGAYLNSTVGNSPLKYLNFSTSNATNGASIKLAMSSIVNEAQLLSALSAVWRIQQSRIGILTSSQKLAELQSTHTSSVMNSRNYIYEIVVAPDTTDDSTKPLDLLNSYTQSSSSIAMLSSLIPQHIKTYTSQVREIIPAKPRPRSNIGVEIASHQKIRVIVKFWEQTFVYGVAIKNSKKMPLSSQIVKSLDSDNNKIVDQQFVFTTSDIQGIAYLDFTLLDDNSTYTVYITAQCALPFTPRIRLSDTQVMSIIITTKLNLSLKKNEKQAVKYLTQLNPKLGAEVKIHMEKVEAAKKAVGQKTNRRVRT